ncbi:MAG: RDD family protein, partial [Candidatus Aminicenantes bacterium]|nr:RDD family protein [Candidatus Aminicenantes bacterium]
FPVDDFTGQQRFLNAVAICLESSSLPLHARPVLQNLEDGTFEKLSFLAGTLRGILDKPAEVSRVIRAGAIFMLPLYVWILVFVGYFRGEKIQQWNDSPGVIVLISIMVVLGGTALIQLLELPFRTTFSHLIFRLAVVNAKGKSADMSQLLVRWAIVWLPLLLPMSVVALLIKKADLTTAYFSALVLLLLWISAAVYAVVFPSRGLHDRLAGTWVVRR